ncbi:OmpA family protein [Pedobacter mendelii]|uniref:Cell envelope biogenesis protein OmpA n=1 Tax=Pedobacter mendelii TaxID=1908240 RepID=A0ABQ2BKT5_9SPHI|nr:OmpA family protein [Pedobacter mendelii]GGI28629.1 cell envelope biogenesis protein OmpA [Pedobacter mendelii]
MNRKYTILMLVLAFFGSYTASYGQEQLSLMEKANLLYVSYQYANAVPIYLKLTDVKNPKLQDVERLADSYLKMNDYASAENWYARVIQYPESKAENLLIYGRLLKSNSKYIEAKKVLQQYAEKTGDLNHVSNEIQGCDSAQLWLAKPTNHKISNEELINTPLSEFGVTLVKGQVFYTGEPSADLLKKVYSRTGNPYLRLFNAEKKSDNVLNNAFINKETYNDGVYHIGPVASNKLGNTLFVTRTYVGKDGEISRENKLKFRNKNLELYIYTLKDGVWDAMAFPYNNIEKYSVGHAALSTDEQTLYFVSDRPGGQGGTDIWYSELNQEGKWGIPQNAGATINSVGDEMFPTIALDGTLYFSSNGLPGMGSLDIFSSKGSKSQWAKPLNLRYPINAAGDDFLFNPTELTDDAVSGYFSSNRKGGKGGDDIYSFNSIKPKIILALSGIVINKKTLENIPEANVTLYKGDKLVVAKQSTTDKGTFFFELDKETDYQVVGQKEKFFSDSAFVSTKGIKKSDTLKVILRLEPLFEVGKIIVLENIHYDFDKDNIRPDAAKILDGLVQIMRDNPTLEIELGSHTDSRGVDAYNLDLSQRRAKSAVNYLVSRGILRSRMTYRGYGETKLLNRCSNGIKCTEEQHQANRRTEFMILKY